jgi:hypothetical protein
MIHLKYECKGNTGCRSVVNRAGSTSSFSWLFLMWSAKNSDPPADRRGSHEGVYGN